MFEWTHDKIHDQHAYERGLKKTGDQDSSKFQKIFRDTEEKRALLTKEDGKEILESIYRLERKLDLIFGDAVIIKGRIVSLGDLRQVLLAEGGE